MKTKKELSKQYDHIAESYTTLSEGSNAKSIKDFFDVVRKYFPKHGKSKSILDFGCGEGGDLLMYRKLGFTTIHGTDSSESMCDLAIKKTNNTSIVISKEEFGSSNFDVWISSMESCFDVIVSKWVVQSIHNVDPIYRSAFRLLKDDGIIIFLIKHPIRQFLEKIKSPKNYFKKEIVQSRIFKKQIIVEEPSHTVEEYLSSYFIEHFELLGFKEGYEFPAAEQIGGDVYPTYMIIVARKK